MLTVTQSCILFFYPPQILIILEEVAQLALGRCCSLDAQHRALNMSLLCHKNRHFFENASKMFQKFPITKLSASELLDNGIATIG
jgi:hypothetical protein